jgi:hypothetical protein
VLGTATRFRKEDQARQVGWQRLPMSAMEPSNENAGLQEMGLVERSKGRKEACVRGYDWLPQSF